MADVGHAYEWLVVVVRGFSASVLLIKHRCKH